jgi:hypothetical protein
MHVNDLSYNQHSILEQLEKKKITKENITTHFHGWIIMMKLNIYCKHAILYLTKGKLKYF